MVILKKTWVQIKSKLVKDCFDTSNHLTTNPVFPKNKFLNNHSLLMDTELHEWSENVVNVENCNFLKVNCGFLFVI